MQESPSLDRGVLHSLHDLDNHLTRSAFPAEAVEEDTVVDDGAPAPFLILDTLESPEDLAIGLLPMTNLLNNWRHRTPNPQTEALENLQLQESRAAWRQLPMSTRVAVRRLHAMTGHSSVSSMQRILQASVAEIPRSPVP